MKRLVMLGSALALSFSLFANGGAESTPKGVSSGNFNEMGLPIVNEKVILTAVVKKDVKHGPYDEMPVLQQMEAATNVRIDWTEIPQSNFEEKKNLILASNDLPDIFMSDISDNDLLIYGSQGVFIPNEKLVEKYAPNLMAIYQEHPEIEKYMTTPDGHKYTAPRIQQLAHRVNPDNMFINKTWLDTLGMDIPETTDEYFDVLKAFKERDPNGNGKSDELSMSFIYPKNGSFDIYSFLGAFGVLDNEANHVTAKNGKILFSPTQNEYKDAVLYMNKLYSEGLIDPEVFTHDIKQYTAKANEPDMIYGVFFAWFDENIVGVNRAENDYVTLPPLKGPKGDQLWGTSPWNVLARGNFAITSVNEYPEISVRWLNECYDLSNSYQLCSGTWDLNIKDMGDKVVYLDPPEGQSQDEFRYKNSPAYTVPFNLDAEAYGKMELTSNHTRKIDRLNTIYKPFFPPIEDIFPKAFFSMEQEEELATLRTDIDGYVSQMFSKWVVGDSNVLSDWDSYQAKLEKMGLSRYVEIHQEAYDAYYK